MSMGDCQSMRPEMEGQDDLIAAARNIARALGSKKNLTDGEREILANLGAQLSTMIHPIDDLNMFSLSFQMCLEWFCCYMPDKLQNYTLSSYFGHNQLSYLN
ncbi:hypothetical protein ACE6H2_018909 [Prunus campanulata]